MEQSFSPKQIDAMIAARRIQALHPFEPLEASPNYRLPTFKKTVASILSKGYPIRPSYLFPLDKPLPWKHEDRTVAYNLHSFEPLSSVLMDHSLNKTEESFAKALVFLEDWLTYVRPPTAQELAGDWNEADKDFLWYDMAVGLRAYRLAYMIDVLLRQGNPDKAKLQKLMAIMDWHRQILMQDDAFCSHNNHGLYQALGQIAMSRRFRDLPDMDTSYKQAEDRLDAMLSQQFFPDGVHREHSPGYHWMVLGTLQEAMRTGLISREDHLLMIGRIEDAMSWFIQPNLMLPAFGDTDSGGTAGGYYQAKDFTHPHLRYALSQGTMGNPPDREMRIFKDAGYAVLRGPNPKTGQIETYFAQQAGFHSKTHKHADHLTFIWHDKGEDILVDTGRYGYKGKTERGSALWEQGFWYADPKRIYAEKTCAHNTVEIDGKDFPRRKAKPFGSAIRQHASTHNHVYAIETECRHFRSIRHNRILFVSPRRFLIVFDWLKDNTGENHDFRQWFHIGTALDLTAHRDSLTVTRNGKPFASILPLTAGIAVEKLIRGQMEPEIQGWVSHDKGGILLPNWAFALTASQRPQATFATLFSLYPEAEPWKPSQISGSGQTGKLYWKDRSGYNTVTFSRRPEEEFRISYTREKELKEE